jgi:hypothetical protein
MIKLQVNKEENTDEKNIVKINLTPDIVMIKEALDYYDSNQYKLEDLNRKIKYIKFIESEKDFEHNEIILYDIEANKLDKAKYEYIGTFDSSTSIWSWAWSIPTMRKKNTTILRKILNYGIELEPTNNFLKTELITSRFRVTNKIQLDIYSAIVSYLSKKPRVIKIRLYNNAKFVITESGENLMDITEPLNSNSKDKNENRYTEYYLFLLD